MNQTHGGPTDTVRHVGDLGNIVTDANNMTMVAITDTVASLSAVMGRASVVHDWEDDLGLVHVNFC